MHDSMTLNTWAMLMCIPKVQSHKNMIPEDPFNGLNLWTNPLWSYFLLNSTGLILPLTLPRGTLWPEHSSSNIHGSSPCSNLRITSGLGIQYPVNEDYMTWNKLDRAFEGTWQCTSKNIQLKKAHLILLWGRGGSPGGSESKESTCNVGDPGLIPGLGWSPGEGNGNPFQCSYLENSMDRAWGTIVHGVTKSWIWLGVGRGQHIVSGTQKG